MIAAAAMGIILLGFRPFETVLGAVAILALVVGCFAKQRLWHGAIGFFVFPVAIYGVCRIGKPGSPWARRRYGERHPANQAKAEARFRDAVGGSTGEAFEAKLADRAGREAAAAEVRRRADRVAD